MSATMYAEAALDWRDVKMQHLHGVLLVLVVLSSAFAASTGATGVLFGNEVYLNGIELGTYTAVTPAT